MNTFGSEFWNERYSAEDYIYGTEPNSFFKEQLEKLDAGKILLPAEGEGRNAVFAAKKGWDVFSFDFSSEAKQKALNLAKANNVKINYKIKSFDDFTSAPDFFDVVAFIYVHLNKEQRQSLFTKAIDSLKKGGKIIFEAFSVNQINKNSGGPKNICLLYTIDDLKLYFNDFKINLLEEQNIYLSEGDHHSGDASVIRFIGTKE